MRGWAAAILILAGAGTASADDVIRLGGTFADDAETHLVHRRWGGYGFYGGHGPRFYGGYGRSFYHGGYYGGGYGGYGGYYGGYHRPYYASFYRPYYSFGYRPYYYSSYYAPYVYSQPYYVYPVYSYSYFDPCAGDERVMPEATTLETTDYAARIQRAAPVVQPRTNGEPTGRYDGGPLNPVPLPGAAPTRTAPAEPQRLVPREGRLVSLPAAPAYTYPAYGETQPAPAPSPGTRLVSAPR